MMMSSWRAYDSTGFQRTSPYGKTARDFPLTSQLRTLLYFPSTRFISNALTPNSSIRTPDKCHSLASFLCNFVFNICRGAVTEFCVQCLSWCCHRS
jgi:hypothetical protein